MGAFATSACFAPSAPSEPETIEPAKKIENSPPLPAGNYDVQNASYDDATGVYKMFVLGAPAGSKPHYQTTELQMARLTDEEIAAGKKSYLKFGDGNAPVLYLTPDFAISYVHNVTEEHVDQRSGKSETVVVAQQTSTWSPFMSAMAGMAIGNMLFSPRYYYPPPYAAGGMTGYGGAGMTRSMAGQEYAQKFGSEPKAARLSKTGMAPRRVSANSLRSTGTGAGSSRLKTPAKPSYKPPRRTGGFGRRR
jgi:hypothetical protein